MYYMCPLIQYPALDLSQKTKIWEKNQIHRDSDSQGPERTEGGADYRGVREMFGDGGIILCVD
jgi:hypothetical protein